VVPYQAGDVWIVFDDKDAGFHGGIVAVRRADYLV
jgi:hypothetical protein